MSIRRRIRASLLFALLTCPAWCQAQVVLRSDFSQPGEYVTKEAVKIDQTLTIAEQSLVTASEQTFSVRYRIGTRDAAGLVPVTMKFESVVARTTLPGGISIEFDSANDDGQNEESLAGLLKGAMRAMLGAELTATIDARGQVQSFTGTEAVLERVGEQAKPLVASQLDEAVLKRSLQTGIDRFPVEPVKPGDVWMRTQVLALGQGQQLIFDERLEYVGPVDQNGRSLQHVRTQATGVRFVIADNATIPLKLKSSDLKVESSSGDIYIDTALRRMVSRQEKINIKGSIVFIAGEMELPSTLDLTLENSHTE